MEMEGEESAMKRPNYNISLRGIIPLPLCHNVLIGGCENTCKSC